MAGAPALLQAWLRPLSLRGGLLILLAGALGSLSLAPLEWWWMLPVSFLPLMPALMAAASPDRPARWRLPAGAWTLGLYGLGWFGASVWWVGEAFLVEADRFALLMPFAILFMALILAFFWALAGALFAWAAAGAGALMAALRLASAWMLMDVVRGCCVFGGFPWNLPAHGMSGMPGMDQVVALVGVEGLSWLAVFLSAVPGLLLIPRLAGRRRLVGVAMALLVLAMGWGLWRLSAYPAADSVIRVRIVQPAIAQTEKWKPENEGWIFRRLLDLSARPPAEGRAWPDVIVWPESAVPFLLEEDPAALKAIGDMLRPAQVLITGALRRATEEGRDARRLKNSILAIDEYGHIIGAYDKRRLVPFGEYLPAGSLLRALGLRKLVPLPRGFRRGDADQPPLPAAAAGLAVGLVCFEAVFPIGPVAEPADRRAGPVWLVNVTNDAWFGTSIGPHQHLEAARLRAIEAGRPLVRAANTGISAVIDPLGRIRARLGLIRKGVIDAALPHPVYIPVASPYGSMFLTVASLLMVMAASLHNLRKGKAILGLQGDCP